MSFTTDKQTLDDLGIFGKRHSGRSIYMLFNKTFTHGGALLLENMFSAPMGEAARINRRSSVIGYFQQTGIGFPVRSEVFDCLEYYFSLTDARCGLATEDNTLGRKVRGLLGGDTEYEQLHNGVLASVELVCAVRDFAAANPGLADSPYADELGAMAGIADDPAVAPLLGCRGMKKLAYAQTAEYDRLLRHALRERMKKLIGHLYLLDVYISVASVAAARGFVFATALETEDNVISMEGVYHPLLENAVANSISIDGRNNVVFLTGANMGGKSTFMKTFGIALFLAHMGFPVPASRMVFSVKSGIFTTINLPDNLSLGYSHFYAEVLRVKKVAQQVGRTGNLVLIFDELFRGTNVKDAYDATVAVTEAFASNRSCTFLISTHIIEAGEELGRRCDNISFVYMPTVMEQGVPRYTYKLAQGITADRHGMVILNNEKILEIILSTSNNA